MQSCWVTAFWATHFAYIFIHFRQQIEIALLKGLVHELDLKKYKNKPSIFYYFSRNLFPCFKISKGDSRYFSEYIILCLCFHFFLSFYLNSTYRLAGVAENSV